MTCLLASSLASEHSSWHSGSRKHISPSSDRFSRVHFLPVAIVVVTMILVTMGVVTMMVVTMMVVTVLVVTTVTKRRRRTHLSAKA